MIRVLLVLSFVIESFALGNFVEESPRPNFFRDDTQSAYQILEAYSGVGNCRWDVEFIPKSRSQSPSLWLRFEMDHRSKPVDFSYRFSNDQSNRSRVDLGWSVFTWDWTSMVLEKVDIRDIPAYKYRIDMKLDGTKILNVRVRKYLSSQSNLVFDAYCD